MEIINIKPSLRKPVLICSGMGVSHIFLFLILPFYIYNAFLGISLFIVGGHYIYKKLKVKQYESKTEKEKKLNYKLLVLIFLVGFVYIFTFIMTFTDSNHTNATLIETEDGIFYESQPSLYTPDGDIYYFDKQLTNANGEMKPEGYLNFPISRYLYHKVSDRQSKTFTYFIYISTNFRLKDNEIEMTIYGSDTSVEGDEEELYKLNITLSEGAFQAWVYEGSAGSIKGTYDYEFLYFKFQGEIEGISETWLNASSMSTVSSINIREDQSDDEWGYTTIGEGSLSEELEGMYEGLEFLTTVSLSLIIIFLMGFFFMMATGHLDKFKMVMFIITIVCVLVLLSLLAVVDELPIIKELIWLLTLPPDWFGVFEALRLFVRILGMVIIVILWFYKIGSVLGSMWTLYYAFNTVLDNFSPTGVGV